MVYLKEKQPNPDNDPKGEWPGSILLGRKIKLAHITL